MQEESIYNIIPKEYVPPTKGPLYRSKYAANIPPTGSTFGHMTTSKPGVLLFLFRWAIWEAITKLVCRLTPNMERQRHLGMWKVTVHHLLIDFWRNILELWAIKHFLLLETFHMIAGIKNLKYRQKIKSQSWVSSQGKILWLLMQLKIYFQQQRSYLRNKIGWRKKILVKILNTCPEWNKMFKTNIKCCKIYISSNIKGNSA